MSAIAISFVTREPLTESVSAHLPASSVNPPACVAPFIGNSGQADVSDLCHEAACELDLLSAAKCGDQLAFAELCRRHGPSLKRTIRRIVRNLEDAEDVLQDTLLSAFRHLAGFRCQCSFRTWITSIATNTSLMLLRKRKNRPEATFGIVTAEGKDFEVLQVSDPMPNPEQVCARRQASHRVSQAIRRLPPVSRSLLEKYHRDENKLVDIANAMGITVPAAKTRLLRARIALRRYLSNDRKLLF